VDAVVPTVQTALTNIAGALQAAIATIAPAVVGPVVTLAPAEVAALIGAVNELQVIVSDIQSVLNSLVGTVVAGMFSALDICHLYANPP
jgi:hypothetical protein